MRVLLSGSSGFIGSEVFSHLRGLGKKVVCLKRGDSNSNSSDIIFWNPDLAQFNPQSFENFDAVIHLAGEPIVGFWTEKKKKKIMSSRVQSTHLLAQILSQTSHPPKVFICASAIGYYGDRGEEALTEESLPGDGFLASVCQAWESAAQTLSSPLTRVVNARFGIVLGKKGGVLQKMRLPFQYGLGCILGSGDQWMSWIAVEDLARALTFCLTQTVVGPVNCVSPHPVRQKEFARLLARSLGKPLFFRLPPFFLRCLLGQMAEEMILASQKVVPKKLDFSFQIPTLEGVFRQ